MKNPLIKNVFISNGANLNAVKVGAMRNLLQLYKIVLSKEMFKGSLFKYVECIHCYG